MWSWSKSALDPISITTLPLTVTKPCAISSSALRLLANPALDMIFCKRSAGMKKAVPYCPLPSVAAFAWSSSSAALSVASSTATDSATSIAGSTSAAMA